jgi:hypothetical protein
LETFRFGDPEIKNRRPYLFWEKEMERDYAVSPKKILMGCFLCFGKILYIKNWAHNKEYLEIKKRPKGILKISIADFFCAAQICAIILFIDFLIISFSAKTSLLICVPIARTGSFLYNFPGSRI